MPRTKKRTRKQSPVDSDGDDVVCKPVAKKRKMDGGSKKKIVSLLKGKKAVELHDDDEVNKFVVKLLANGKGYEIVKGKIVNKGRKSTKKCDSKEEAMEAATELLLSKISDESFVLFEPQSESESESASECEPSASESQSEDDDDDDKIKDESEQNEPEEEKKYKTIKMKAKERVPVDDSFYTKNRGCGEFHVLQDVDGVIYDAMLNQTNIAQNNNKFYKLQVLQKTSGGGGAYAAFFRWGRVGYEGQTSTTFGDKARCIAAFCKKFHDKAANKWEDRDDFVAKKGKYTYLPMDYGADSKQDEEEEDDDSDEDDMATKKKKKKKLPECKLHPSVQDLVKLIFDKDMFDSQMKEIGYDAAKLPLGKVDKSIISQAYEILKCIESELNAGSEEQDDDDDDEDESGSAEEDDDDDDDGKKKKKKKRRSKRQKHQKKNKSTKSTRRVFREALNDLSSQYYTLIPHEFKFRKPPLIDNTKLLRKEMELVEALSEIEVANRLLSGDKKQAHVDRHPIEKHFDLLKCDLQHVDNETHEFELIERYVQSTHASTHNAYSLQVENVFKLDRSGASQRFEKFEQSDNRMLLFHGSRLTNFVGIISQGLRIAPPEAPVTGYMFGKGVYFADSSSKSANYCFTTATNNTGLMLLCEVALGKMNELYYSDYYAADLPQGCSSTKGVGRIHPDPSTWQTLDNGCVVPTGKHVEERSFDGALMYNEYIVYDTKQIKMKYLLKLKFDYTDNDDW